jgi:hypothetical protein
MDGTGTRLNNNLSFSRVIDSLVEPCYNYDIATKEHTMRYDTLTVADLIAILNRVDPNLPVKMAMNQEYECEVDVSMIGVREYDEGPVLYINDCLGDYEDEDNG